MSSYSLCLSFNWLIMIRYLLLSSSYSLSYSKFYSLSSSCSSFRLHNMAYFYSVVLIVYLVLSSVLLSSNYFCARSQLSRFIWSIVMSYFDLLSSLCSFLIFHSYLFFLVQFFYTFLLHLYLLSGVHVFFWEKWKLVKNSYLIFLILISF